MSHAQSDCLIRIATGVDIPLIRSLALTIWPGAYGKILLPEQISYMLESMYSEAALNQQFNTGHVFLIAEEEGKPVGFGAHASTTYPDLYRLQKLYVLSSVQGKGIGKALLDKTIKMSKACGATTLQLNVNRHNQARRFYEKEGFKIIREEDLPIGNDYFMNDYVMEKTI